MTFFAIYAGCAFLIYLPIELCLRFVFLGDGSPKSRVLRVAIRAFSLAPTIFLSGCSALFLPVAAIPIMAVLGNSPNSLTLGIGMLSWVLTFLLFYVIAGQSNKSSDGETNTRMD